ncbi:MFS transporter [Streptoalloteichus hindustanus]|uniref:Drug resistance transporter, EmrB/QacA subfamily n=1 Tax=Streptoalloteichus hindustanus TaxID=2017 RepID=A0A1M5FQS8_STRHI|nr:MFS transporter [Streptoalloteichus hindustanus]SHF93865.1 drug resistance transporter, EmrB/QacA subfamily [Streptoalloteichus hindustanus]
MSAPLDHRPEAGAAPPAPVSWRPLVAACLGTFLLVVYTTIVTVALPRIGADLGGGFGALQWVVDVFTVALAGLLLGMGSLSDNLGRRRVYLVGLVAFGLATLGCGLAGSVSVLIAARAAQGIAGAAMFATILPLVGLTYRGPARARAFAVWGTVAGAAGAVGTVAGGVLAELLGWRWIFLGSLPLCAVAVVLGVTSLTESDRAGNRVDLPGIVTFTLAATALTYTVINGGDHGWSARGTVVGAAVTVLAAVAFVVAERRSPAPMVPPALFGTRAFVGVLVVAFSYYFSGFGALPVLSLWLQENTGLGALNTSLVLAVQVVVFFLVSALISDRLHGPAPSLVLGGATVLIGLGCAAAAAVLISPQWTALVPMLVVTGFGAGMVSPVFPAVAIAAVPASYGGTAGAAANSSRQLGLALGIALCGTIYRAHGPDTTGGVVDVMLCCAVLAVLGGALAAGLLRGHQRQVASSE